MRIAILMFLVLINQVIFAQETHPFSTNGKINVILDTDMGNDIDDALALDMLFKYMDKGKVKLLGIMNNKDSEYSRL